MRIITYLSIAILIGVLLACRAFTDQIEAQDQQQLRITGPIPNGVLQPQSANNTRQNLAPQQPLSFVCESPEEADRLTWGLLETIEQHHFLAPSHENLIRYVVPFLTGIEAQPELDAAITEFLRCQNADEFSATLKRHSYVESRSIDEVEPLPWRVLTPLQNWLGTLRVVPDKERVVQEQLRGNRYVGLGIALNAQTEDGAVVISKVVPGGVAHRAGLVDGTRIYEVNGHSTEKVALQTIVDWIRGPIGTEVTIKVAKPELFEPVTITVKRNVIRIDSVHYKHVDRSDASRIRYDDDHPIGWLDIDNLTSSTLHELRQAELHANDNGIRVMVLNFQNAFGAGDLHQALLIADALMGEGPIWIQLNRDGTICTKSSDAEHLFRNMPLVIALGPNSGSACIVLAAALQDAGRAIIVGSVHQFSGHVMSAEKIPSLPYSIELVTAKLVRSRTDRNWDIDSDWPLGGLRPDRNNDLPGRTQKGMPRGVRVKQDYAEQLATTKDAKNLESEIHPTIVELARSLRQFTPEKLALEKQFAEDLARAAKSPVMPNAQETSRPVKAMEAAREILSRLTIESLAP